jgi:hypothetical protein
MSTASLSKKMKLKPGQRAAIINAPEGYQNELSPLPDGVELATSLRGKFDWVQIFVKNRAELAKIAGKAAGALKPDSLLWISFPKGASKIQTDLTRDQGWEAVQALDLRWVNLVSVNNTWSAFALRPYRPGEERHKAWS